MSNVVGWIAAVQMVIFMIFMIDIFIALLFSFYKYIGVYKYNYIYMLYYKCYI